MGLGENPAQKGSNPVPLAHTFNGRKKAAFLLELVKTGSIRGAASRIGVTPGTVYDHAKKDPTFADGIERARGEWEQSLVDGIVTAGLRGKVIEKRTRKGETLQEIEPGDWRALAWALEHAPTTRERYAGILRQKVELGGDPDGAPLQIQSQEQLQIELGPDTMERLTAVVQVLVNAGKIRLPDPNEIEGTATDVTPDDG